MKDIIPKSMKDVTVPQQDIVRRSNMTPESRPVNTVAVAVEGKDRIGKSLFFEKGPSKSAGWQSPKWNIPHLILWFFAVAILLGAGFAVANYFAAATVEITPVTRSATVAHDFTAVTLEGSKENDLVFNFATSTEEKTKEIPATVEKKIQNKASGRVIIFNAYNGEKQRLIKNTRLEDNATHKIYRIDESVVVPGATIVSGKDPMPGSVEAVVYADGPGDGYDIKFLSGAGDFSIPGFKGDPRFAKFYGRMSQKFPIGGGFSGAVKVPSDEAVIATQEELKQDLKKIAVEKARAQIPDNMLVFPGSMILRFEEMPQVFAMQNIAKVSMRATVSAFFFDAVPLMQKLTESSLPEYQGNLFLIPNISALTFSFIDPVDNVVLSDLTKIRFHIAGDAVFVGKIDEQKIRTALTGKDKKDFGKIVGGERNVSKAEVVIRPMWNTVFPRDPAKITVKLLDK